ncbi:MAG: hypothetical protein QW112_03240, partial [Candidatus Micrarchaeia archaeon]
ISLCEKERSVQNPVEANNIQMEKYSCKNSAIRTRERVHQIINAFEDAMDLLAERRKEIVDTSINGEWPSLKNWENLTRSSLPGVGSMMISLSINMGSEKFGSFKNNMLSYTNPEHIEVCAREIIRTCNEAVSIVRERERRAKAQEENQKIQAEVQEEAYHVAKGFRSTGRQAAQAKNGRKVVAESVAVMGGAAALYGLVKDLPYVAAAGLTFTLLGADAARRSWKETGEFISGLISRGGFVTGLVATFTSGIACLIQHTQILSAYTADKTTNDIIVAAKFFFEYVSSVGEPLKLMIGGAIVTFAAPIIGAVIRAVTDSSDN